MQAAVQKAYITYGIHEMSGSQHGFPYTPDAIDGLVRFLSPDRMKAYYTMAKGNPEGAMRLYERNIELSEAMYGVVQGFEITLRNAIDNRLTPDLGLGWFRTFPFLESEQFSIADAVRKIEARFEKVTRGGIIGELNFGFWVRLFSSAYDRTLWGPCLSKIVPRKLPRRAVYDRLQSIKTLRNRIAHHDRIIGKKQTVAELYDMTIESIGWFSPITQSWIEGINCVGERLARKFAPLRTIPTVTPAAVARKTDRNPPTSSNKS